MACQVTIRPSNLLMPNDKRNPITVAIRNFIQCRANGRFDQRLRPITLEVAKA